MSVKKAIVIHGYDFGTSEEEIRGHCSAVGKVVSITLKGQSSAIVEYTSENQAMRAMAELQETFIPGNERYITVKLKNVAGQAGPSANSLGKLPAPSKSKGASKGAAQMALPATGQVFRPSSLKGGAMGAQPRAREPTPSAKPTTAVRPSSKPPTVITRTAGAPAARAQPAVVSVNGFDFGTTEQAIRQHLSKAGRVESVELKGSGGSALVTFSALASALKAKETLNNTVIPGNTRYISLKVKGGGSQQAELPLRTSGPETPVIPPWRPTNTSTQLGVKRRITSSGQHVAQPTAPPMRTMQPEPTQLAAAWANMQGTARPLRFMKPAQLAAAKAAHTAGMLAGFELAAKAGMMAGPHVTHREQRARDFKAKQAEAGAKPLKKAGAKAGAKIPTASHKLKLKAAAEGIAQAKLNRKKVMVRGLDINTPEETIRDHFSEVGKVRSVDVNENGIVAVTYATEAAALRAREILHETVIDGNEGLISVRLKSKAMCREYGIGKPLQPEAIDAPVQTTSKRKREPEGVRTVKVRGYDHGTPLDAIVEHCSMAGTIVESRHFDNNNSCGYLTYASAEEAEAAVEMLDKSTIDGNNRYIDVRLTDIDQGSRKKVGKVEKTKVIKSEHNETGIEDISLTREVITGEIMTGTIAKLKESGIGWIKTDEDWVSLLRPDQRSRIGRKKLKKQDWVFMNPDDVLYHEPLVIDDCVQFVLYVDDRGVGAQDVSPIS